MSDGPTVTVSVFPAGTLLTVVFIMLKVFDKIQWSWWWVFSPLWLPALITLIFWLAVVVIMIGSRD